MRSLVLFASGKGSNVAAIISHAIISHFRQTGHAAVSLIVSNNANAAVLDLAREAQIPFLIVDRETINGPLLAQQVMQYKPDLIVLAGFLWKIPGSLLERFEGRIINIHPALLPEYGGKGMYGRHVHEAVIATGAKESGITIHYVNEHYDEGNRILQARYRLAADETAESLAKQISRLEHYFFPRTIEYLLLNNN
jgi:phosphoribosylglycinamide formyltransferase 1